MPPRLRTLFSRIRHSDGPPPPAPGEELLPGYRNLGHLRRGAELDVFDAWSARRSSRVIIKAPRPDRRERARTVEHLLEEGRMLQRLTHPHIGRCYEVHTEPPGIVLETLGGQTLTALLDERDRLEPTEVGQLGLQLASAIAYMHGAGILHLDVKPGNLIAEAGRVRLIDMNLARPPGPVKPGYGTDAYMSPEQERGGEVGTAADVWGVAIVLAEAGGGDPDQRDPLDGCPQPVRRALDRALDPDPARRAKISDLLGELQELAEVPPEERHWTRY